MERRPRLSLEMRRGDLRAMMRVGRHLGQTRLLRKVRRRIVASITIVVVASTAWLVAGPGVLDRRLNDLFWALSILGGFVAANVFTTYFFRHVYMGLLSQGRSEKMYLFVGAYIRGDEIEIQAWSSAVTGLIAHADERRGEYVVAVGDAEFKLRRPLESR